jgi:hypothetical protein
MLVFVELAPGAPVQESFDLGIDGWGFLPGCTFTMNSVPVEVVHWYSAVRVAVRVPAGTNFTRPITLTVQNPDGTSDTRTDLF